MNKLLVSLMVIELLNVSALATETNSSTAEETQIVKMAREKSYPGGRDEDDLEVQTQVQKPVRKMGNSQENSEAPSNDDEF